MAGRVSSSSSSSTIFRQFRGPHPAGCRLAAPKKNSSFPPPGRLSNSERYLNLLELLREGVPVLPGPVHDAPRDVEALHESRHNPLASLFIAPEAYLGTKIETTERAGGSSRPSQRSTKSGPASSPCGTSSLKTETKEDWEERRRRVARADSGAVKRILAGAEGCAGLPNTVNQPGAARIRLPAKLFMLQGTVDFRGEPICSGEKEGPSGLGREGQGK